MIGKTESGSRPRPTGRRSKTGIGGMAQPKGLADLVIAPAEAGMHLADPSLVCSLPG